MLPVILIAVSATLYLMIRESSTFTAFYQANYDLFDSIYMTLLLTWCNVIVLSGKFCTSTRIAFAGLLIESLLKVVAQIILFDDTAIYYFDIAGQAVLVCAASIATYQFFVNKYAGKRIVK